MTGSGRVVAEWLAVPTTAVDAVDVCWHEPPDPSGVAVLVTHGAGGDLTDHVLVELADELAGGGHLVGRVNLPYRQRRASGPPPRAEASVADLASVLAAAGDARPGHRWVLGGKSYGGRVATLVAAEPPDHAHDHPVGLLCVSYPLHPPGRPDRLRVAHFPDVVVPMLVVQGGDDPFGGPDELRPHLATLGGPARLLEVPHADHGLHVARTRSADGRTHRSADVLAHRGGELRAWLSTLTG